MESRLLVPMTPTEKIGKDLGELCGIDSTGVRVTDQLNRILPKCDLAVMTTASSMEKTHPLLEEVVKAKKFVVS